MNSVPQNKFQDFVDDQFFVDWVKNPTAESDQYWKQYIAGHPSEKESIDQAKYILAKFQTEKKRPNDDDVRNVWLNIQSKTLNPQRKVRFMNAWSVAASIVLIIGISVGVLFRIIENRNTSVNYTSMTMMEPEGNEVKLILSDNSEKRFATKDPSIRYNQNGEILVDSVTFNNETSSPNNPDKEAFNQLLVPKGKRSSLTFSDGTRLYLNSGSQVIYPVTFNKKSREIYISGEAYLDVAHDAGWPFIVKTDHLDVKVLGTEFNIKSYPDETNSTIVLVKGSVQAIVKSQKIVMKESELFTLDNATEKSSLGKANVLEYVSWKDGWMYCTNERIDNIARKLSRYYDVNIQFNDDKVKDMTLTGKLDLKTECREVFDVISFIAPVDYKIIDGNIILSAKIK
ncbi:MAG: FecR domain-containing protein [Bacteroidetes bacterium]|nr:FecR domain-containing protein [Bacteroidota bacterium]